MNFGFDRRGRPEGGIVEGCQILRDSPVGLRVELIGRLDPALTMRVRDDHAGVDRKALATD
jgi:hypothetical protein